MTAEKKEHPDVPDPKGTRRDSGALSRHPEDHHTRGEESEQQFIPQGAEPMNAESKDGDARDEKRRSRAKPQRALQSRAPREESGKCAKVQARRQDWR